MGSWRAGETLTCLSLGVSIASSYTAQCLPPLPGVHLHSQFNWIRDSHLWHTSVCVCVMFPERFLTKRDDPPWIWVILTHALEPWTKLKEESEANTIIHLSLFPICGHTMTKTNCLRLAPAPMPFPPHRLHSFQPWAKMTLLSFSHCCQGSDRCNVKSKYYKKLVPEVGPFLL